MKEQKPISKESVKAKSNAKLDRAFEVFMDSGCTIRELADKTGISLIKLTDASINGNWENLRAKARTAAIMASNSRMEVTRRVDGVITANAETAASVALPEYIKAMQEIAAMTVPGAAKVPMLNEATEGFVKFIKGLRDVGLVVVPREQDLNDKAKPLTSLLPQATLIQINSAITTQLRAVAEAAEDAEVTDIETNSIDPLS